MNDHRSCFLQKLRALTGFEPTVSVLALQCSINELPRPTQFVAFMATREKNKT